MAAAFALTDATFRSSRHTTHDWETGEKTWGKNRRQTGGVRPSVLAFPNLRFERYRLTEKWATRPYAPNSIPRHRQRDDESRQGGTKSRQPNSLLSVKS